jgi:hypothetical protein
MAVHLKNYWASNILRFPPTRRFQIVGVIDHGFF